MLHTKKIQFILFLMLFGLISCSANDDSKENNESDENTFNGNITLTTQDEINEFGANNYKIIIGDLIIDENQAIHDIVFIDKLSSITTITGSLTITNMFNWLDIPSGFENLTTIGQLTISDNWGILDLNGLTNLSNCKGAITITNNNDLSSFCGIKSLLDNGAFKNTFTATGNFYNPTKQDIIDGNCE